MVYKQSRKGAQGIGTLIIFIALILVAALAAGVLISTVGKLQGKAETTGQEIQQRLGTGFDVVEVTGTDTSDGNLNNGTDKIRVTLRLSPGSDPVKFKDITLTLVTDAGLRSYTNTTAAATTSLFNVSQVAGDITDGYMNRVDVVNLDFVTQYDIGENEEFTVRLFPGVGNPVPIKLITPPSMTSVYTVLK